MSIKDFGLATTLDEREEELFLATHAMVTAMQMQQRIVPTVDAAIPEPAPVEIV